MTVIEFSLSVLASIVAFVITCLASVFRNFVREWLRKSSGGFLRRCYVGTFIAAVRGESQIECARNIAVLMLAFPFALLGWTNMYQTQAKALQSAIADQAISVGSLKQRLDSPPADQSFDIDREIVEMEKLIEKNQYAVSNIVKFLSVVNVFNFTWIAYMVLVWLPRTAFRVFFENEFQRFMTRISLLASKAELAVLVVKESAVKDEKTAREFVCHLAKIAKRHEISSLVRSFQLWGDTASELAE
jgi:hypothetical protein